MATTEVEDFSQMDHEIHLKPWLSYQKLIAMQAEAQSYDKTKYLWWLVRKAQAERAIYFYRDFDNTIKQAMSLITDQTPIAIQARLNIFQGVSYRRHGKYTFSQQVLSKALNQAKEAHLSRIYIVGKKELAFTKVLTEYYETSLEDLQEAYVEAFALKDLFLMASINEVYGVVYGHLKEFEKSIEYYKRALDSYKHLQYPAEIAKASGGLASSYRYWKKYDLAIKYFKRYQKNISYIPNSNNHFFSAYAIAVTYAEKGDCKLALIAIERALKLQGLEHHDAELYKKKASCLIALNRLDEAEEALFNAAKHFSSLPDLMGTSWQLEVIKISGELAHARGNYDLGYKMLKQYYQKYTELLLQDKSNQLESIKSGVGSQQQEINQMLEKKRLEVELLEFGKHNAIVSQKLYYSILIFCMLLTIAVVVVLQLRNNKKIHKLTIIDPLSNLFNRRYVFDFLSNIISDATPNKVELSVILIDIDNLKKVNDMFGNKVGDDVICSIANIGKQVFRQSDAFSRIGGEEYLCALPRTNIGEAEKIAKRFLHTVSKLQLVPDPQCTVTVSIGVAALSTQHSNATQLFAHADQALYQAKYLGKNQVNVFQS